MIDRKRKGRYKIMKILLMTWSIYDDRIKEFAKNCTGGGLVVKNLCEYIGRKEEAYLFLGAYKLPEIQLGNFSIAKTDDVPDIAADGDTPNEIRLKTMTKAFEKTLYNLQPDVVNLHGKGDLVQRCIEVCMRSKVPFVYTEHLFISRNRMFAKYDQDIIWEKQIFCVEDLHVIAVSAGMKRAILKDFPDIFPDHIVSIANGTDFVPRYVDSNLPKEYELKGKKVLLCVGTLLARKNQIQIVHCFSLLPENIKTKIKIIFCGKDGMDGKLQEEINKFELQDSLIYAGAFSSEVMKEYYSVAEGLIMPSLAEGLSIAALEAIAYGIPVIMFSDSECAEDLNDPKVVCLAENRSDKALAESIAAWYQKEWDREYIIKYAKYFGIERMAQDYINYYYGLLGKCR